jgi:Ni,Fe-hydrogenase III component G
MKHLIGYQEGYSDGYKQAMTDLMKQYSEKLTQAELMIPIQYVIKVDQETFDKNLEILKDNKDASLADLVLGRK